MTVGRAVPGDFPLVANGPDAIATHNTWNREGDFLVVARSGANAGSVSRWQGPVFLTDAFSVHPNPSRLSTGFAYYALQARQGDLLAMGAGGGVPHVRVKDVQLYRIPVPPLYVQLEIVEALDALNDSISSLCATLDFESTARARQFDYYRNLIMEFRGSAEVAWLPMSEVGTFVRGRRFTKGDISPVGIPAIHYGEIYTHYGVSATEALSRVRGDMRDSLRFAKPGDVVIAGVGETVEDVAKPVAWVGKGEVAIHDDTFAFRSSADAVYISHVMRTGGFQVQKARRVARGKVKRVGSDNLGRIVIPVPDLEEQRRIVAVLERFDSLSEELTSRLVAEIESRRMQYAYYRDRLLAFEEATA